MTYAKTLLASCLAIGLTAVQASAVQAAVSADEAKALGTTLTPWGAEIAGNADGSIPAYTGGLTSVPASCQGQDLNTCDPFADEKPLYTINAGNMAQYADHLPVGAAFMLQRWPTFHINVYPTHRTAAFPKEYGEWAIRNATSANLVQNGNGVEGAFGAIPFPIPKSGLEAIWNHLLYGRPYIYEGAVWTNVVNANGGNNLSTQSLNSFEMPYYDYAKGKLEDLTVQKLFATYVAPARTAGEVTVMLFSSNYDKQEATTWAYQPGQRRVRLAPEYKYDTPIPAYSGMIGFDEAFTFSGAPDRYDWKLVGKQELIVPYNGYKLNAGAPTDWNSTKSSAFQIAGPQHLKPELQRWEKHRVWKVEATLKEGKRHAYAKRVLYFDEDSFTIIWHEGYDASGALYRLSFTEPYQLLHMPLFNSLNLYAYDFVKGAYMIQTNLYKPRKEPYPPLYFTPDNMGGAGIR